MTLLYLRSDIVTTAEMQDKVREIVEQHVQTSMWHLAKCLLISDTKGRDETLLHILCASIENS